MYTKCPSDSEPDAWEILDPDGDTVCIVIGQYSADDLLSHLNR
jgi:hypothetical protein